MHTLLLAFLSIGQECQQATARGRDAYERQAYADAASHFADARVACADAGQTTLDDLVLAHAQALLLAGRPPAAIEAIASLLAYAPTHVAALKLRARARYLTGADAEAEADLRTAAQLAPRDAEIPYDLGRIHAQQGRHRDAYTAFGQALALDPRAYRAHDNLGLAAEALGDPDAALRHYLAAIAIVSADPSLAYGTVYANLADLLLRRGEHRRAFDAAAEAAARSPREARHFFLAGKALVHLQQDAIAVKWLEQSASLDAAYAEPHYLLAQVYRRLGRTTDAARALAAFERLAALGPRERR